MRRFVWLLPLLVVGACKGLLLDAGNAYPCDFSQGPGVRDAACIAGDVCGANNLCQKYIYEGPRFEGEATVPSYGPESGEGEVLHPLALTATAGAVLADLPLGRSNVIYVQESTGTIRELKSGHLLSVGLTLPNMPVGFSALKGVQTFFDDEPQLVPNVIVQDAADHLAIGGLDAVRLDPVKSGAGLLMNARFRVVGEPSAGLLGTAPRSRVLAWTPSVIGQVDKSLPGWTFTAWGSAAGVLDVAAIVQPQRLWVVALLDDEVKLFDRNDGGTDSAALDPLTVTGGSLRSDPGTRIISAIRETRTPLELDVLSTFQVNIGADGPVLTSPWPDCAPCPAGTHVELMTPSVRSGAPNVEVVCVGGGFPKALRVIGSVSLTQKDACLTEDFTLPMPFTRVAVTGAVPRLAAVQWNNQTGALLGGTEGELWSGETISALNPLFLERVPLDVAPAVTGVGMTRSLAAITDRYLAVQQTPENQLPTERLNGFRQVSTRELGVGDSSRLMALVHGTGGWGIANSGEVVHVRISASGASVESGPVLVAASGDPIRDSIGGEAFTGSDGGVAFVLAADDGLYLLEDPEGSLPVLDGTAEQELLTPVLTPEPSVPIRSLALERTPLGTELGENGLSRARGYLVTSRNVYSWELAGTPARWSATPLVLAGGEPVEVWFDQTRSALGRVGYSDGQIYTLPGGHELVEPLPADDEGLPAQVLDYENLGGWPVAYATTGIFVAGWDKVGTRLQNRFPDGGINRPMSWRELTIPSAVPDGGTPWMKPRKGARPGKLFVATDSVVTTSDGTHSQAHHLLLFLDDQVLQIATHVRNIK